MKSGNQNLGLYKDMQNGREYNYFNTLKLFNIPNLRQATKRKKVYKEIRVTTESAVVQ